jgi:hypothetical protein
MLSENAARKGIHVKFASDYQIGNRSARIAPAPEKLSVEWRQTSALVFLTHTFSHGLMGGILHRYHDPARVATACSCGGFSPEIK